MKYARPVAVLLIMLMAGTVAFKNSVEPWQFMWLLCFELYAFFKWITLVHYANTSSRINFPLLYLLAWVGMDPAPFARRGAQVSARTWLLEGTLNFVTGVSLILSVQFIPSSLWLAQGWLICAGLVFMLHFGIFKILAWCINSLGFAVEPIMKNPLLAKSVSEFWGGRWNVAFKQLVYPLVYNPLKMRLGATVAVVATFIFGSADFERDRFHRFTGTMGSTNTGFKMDNWFLNKNIQQCCKHFSL